MSDLINKSNLNFLQKMTGDVIHYCRVYPGQAHTGYFSEHYGRFSVTSNAQSQQLIQGIINQTGKTLIVPAGCGGYPAFWIEDFTLALTSGFICECEVRGMFNLIMENQNGPETLHLDSGAEIPAFAIPNHVLFNGKPVFFPGTYSPGPDQGGEPFGNLPDLDDDFYAIEIAYWLFYQTKDAAFFTSLINGITVIDRLEKAFYVPDVNPTTELVKTTKTRRGTNWGFVDTIQMTGELLFCSILRFRAAKRLAAIFNVLGNKGQARKYQEVANRITEAIQNVFVTECGWLIAATEQCRQNDIWGTVYAVYENVLEGELKQNALSAILFSYRNGISTLNGNVRHILTNEDWSTESAWECTNTPLNTYQNGAYWGTPSGWFLYALNEISPQDAKKFVDEYINELRNNDFRRKGSVGSPLECFHPEAKHWQNPVYLTSVAGLLSALYRLGYK